MNTKRNARYQETEQQIIDAFIHLLNCKTINNISVSDLCKTGHLSRPTFYAHYEDINDLIYKIEQEKSKRIKELLILSEATLHDKFVKYFEFLKENQQFYHAYFSMESNSSLVNEMMQSYKEKQIADHTYSVTEKYYMHFFKSGIKEIAAEWLKNDCKESPLFMADLLTDGLSAFIKERM